MSAQRTSEAYYEIVAAGAGAGAGPPSRGREITLHAGTAAAPLRSNSGDLREGIGRDRHSWADDGQAGEGGGGYDGVVPYDSVSFPPRALGDDGVVSFRKVAGADRPPRSGDGSGVLQNFDSISFFVPAATRVHKPTSSERSPYSESGKGPFVSDMLAGSLEVDDPFRRGIEDDGGEPLDPTTRLSTSDVTGRSQNWSVRNDSPERRAVAEAGGGGSSMEDVFDASAAPGKRVGRRGLPFLTVRRAGAPIG
jgi:hypothetical protein